MSKRRNSFEISEAAPTPTAPPSIYESLRMTSPRKRNRQWEKEHQSQKAVYRGIDPKLALKVKSIADDLVVPTGEVARALIEFALRAYAEGDLDLNPRPNPYRMRMTLFPASDSLRSSDRPGRSSKRKQQEALWKFVTTWRGFPPELKRGLAALASDDGLNVPVGELITALLRFGLKAHNYGLVSLEPVQKAIRFTLTFWDGK